MLIDENVIFNAIKSTVADLTKSTLTPITYLSNRNSFTRGHSSVRRKKNTSGKLLLVGNNTYFLLGLVYFIRAFGIVQTRDSYEITGKLYIVSRETL